MQEKSRLKVAIAGVPGEPSRLSVVRIARLLSGPQALGARINASLTRFGLVVPGKRLRRAGESRSVRGGGFMRARIYVPPRSAAPGCVSGIARQVVGAILLAKRTTVVYIDNMLSARKLAKVQGYFPQGTPVKVAPATGGKFTAHTVTGWTGDTVLLDGNRKLSAVSDFGSGYLQGTENGVNYVFALNLAAVGAK